MEDTAHSADSERTPNYAAVMLSIVAAGLFIVEALHCLTDYGVFMATYACFFLLLPQGLLGVRTGRYVLAITALMVAWLAVVEMTTRGILPLDMEKGPHNTWFAVGFLTITAAQMVSIVRAWLRRRGHDRAIRERNLLKAQARREAIEDAEFAAEEESLHGAWQPALKEEVLEAFRSGDAADSLWATDMLEYHAAHGVGEAAQMLRARRADV